MIRLAFVDGSKVVETVEVPARLSVRCLTRAEGFARDAARFEVRPADGGGREIVPRGAGARCGRR